MSAAIANQQTMPATGNSKAHGLAGLTLRLTRARFQAKAGESLLYFAGILAYTVAAGLAFTVAGGTWMFWSRKQHPNEFFQQLLAEDPTFSVMFNIYIGLALLACALLLPAMANLASGAALLGARGREQRLATLRLIGLTSADVIKMSLLDALIQAVVGILLGGLIYLVTLPLWGNLEMMAQAIQPGEMLLPCWLWLPVAVGVLLVGLLATVRSLRQVSISPLGVARRANQPKLSWLRPLLFLGLVVSAFVIAQLLSVGDEITGFLIVGTTILMMMAGVNLVGPWLLQVAARISAQLPWAGNMWASRRIAADPKATWRRLSGLTLLAFIGGFMAMMPFTMDPDSDPNSTTASFVEKAQWDFSKGVVITLAVGFALTATSLLISQASDTIERAAQAQALHKMGAPKKFNLQVMWLETYVPMLFSVLLAAALGTLPAMPMVPLQRQLGVDTQFSLGMIAAVIGAGLVLTALALLAIHPLYYRLLGEQRRRND